MTYLSTLTLDEMSKFLKIIQDSLPIRRHKDLFDWLNEEVQTFLPHDILLTAWGDFSLGLVHLDIVSYLPGLRTTEVEKDQLTPLLFELFKRWEASNRTPFSLSLVEDEARACFSGSSGKFGGALKLMRSALIQGMKDQRGRHDCLYVALSSNRIVEKRSLNALEVLLPYLDAALRQVVHLPVQYPDYPDVAPDLFEKDAEHGDSEPSADNLWHLSQREVEIMHWVCMGKTNSEIGQILDISFFTVKNHLQRIFRKLDVLNRAQGVVKFKQLTGKEPSPNDGQVVK